MRKLTATLLAGAAAAVTATGASATGPALLAGTYIENSDTTSSCDGRPAPLQQESVYNFAGFGKAGDYSNSSVTPALTNLFPALGFTTYNNVVPTGFGTSPTTGNVYSQAEALTEEIPGSFVPVYTATQTSTAYFLDKNTALIETLDTNGCGGNSTLIRVGK